MMGYPRLEEHPGVHLVNLDHRSWKQIQTVNFEFEIPQLLSDIDIILTITKMKTHTQATASLSLKNQMGLVNLPSKRMMHLQGIHDCIAELNTIIKPSIGIIDGILAMDGQGPHNGREFRADLLLGGNDLVELDSLACFLMGHDYHAVGYIEKSEKLGVGRIVSEDTRELYRDLVIPFKPAEPFTEAIKNVYIWTTNACASCAASMVELGVRLKSMQGNAAKFDLPRIDFIMGSGEGLDISQLGTVFGIGDCAKHFCEERGIECLPGCPQAIYKVGEFAIDCVENVAIKQIQLGFRYLRLGLLNRVMDVSNFKREYDQICNTYEDLWGEYTKPFNEAMLDVLDFSSHMDVLDLACGTGQNTLKIAQKVAPGKVVGIDISSGMLDWARQRAAEQKLVNVMFVEEDMINAFTNPEVIKNFAYDRILCLWAIGYSKPVEVLNKARTLLKPGGKLGIIANMDEHPSAAYKITLELMAEFPKALQVMVKHNFPKTMEEFKQFFKDAGYPEENLTFEEKQFEIVVPDGKAALDWLLKTGSGSLFDDAVKKEWKDQIRELFTQRIKRFRTEEGIKLEHRFVVAYFTNPT